MIQRIARRKSVALITACAGAYLLTRGGQAVAGLMVDLRATGSTNPHDVITPKNVVTRVGSTIFLELVARVSGMNAVQQIGNFDGQPPFDTRNDDSVNRVTGSFQSPGGLLRGDFDPTDLNQGAVAAGFISSTAHGGTASDWDSDGDLDIGNNGTELASMFDAFSGAPQYATISRRIGESQPRLGWSGGTGTLFIEDLGGPNSQVPQTRILDATTSEMLVGEVAWTVTGGTGSTGLVFVPRPLPGFESALWFEDGLITGKTPGTGSFSVGAPILVSLPEPTSCAVLGTVAIGLVARRRTLTRPTAPR